MSDTIGISIGVALLLLITVGALLARASEKRAWNNGICLENGLAWECFDVASDGSRGYKTHRRVGEGDDRRVIWISSNVDKKVTTNTKHHDTEKE